MATITIRNLPDVVHHRLRIQAAQNNRSMEAEARAILDAALADKTRRETALQALVEIQEALREANGGEIPQNMVDELIADRRRESEAKLAALSEQTNSKGA